MFAGQSYFESVTVQFGLDNDYDDDDGGMKKCSLTFLRPPLVYATSRTAS